MRKLYLALAAAGALLLGGVGFSRCVAPSPASLPQIPTTPPVSGSAPTATAIASSSSTATTEFEFEAIIPPRRVAQNPYTIVQASPLGSQTQQPRGGKVDEFSPGPYSIEQEEPIVIRIRQTATAAAISGASAKILEDSETRLSNPRGFQNHARLGTMVATVPGAIALTYQVTDVEIPPWVLGTPLELGLEVEGNLNQLGAGVSVGGKAFASAGGYLGWDGPGWYVGLGMRF